MNISIIDLIMVLVLVVGAINGFRKGVISQLGGVVGVIAGVWLAFRLGSGVSAMIGVEMSPLVSYIVVFVAAILAMWLLSHILGKLLSTIGLGIVNRLCGAAVSLVLSSMILSLAFGFFEKCNNALQMVEPEVLEASEVAPIVNAVADVVFPYLERAKDAVVESVDTEEPMVEIQQVDTEEESMEAIEEATIESEQI
ncbi:MAG: CvpA family protein [Tidjanibacter sp.]|nr:CvpA family protein [Tidjanibacter sp.]